MRRLATLIAAAALVLAACDASPGPSRRTLAPGGAVTVTLGIYSGRPDPAWTLSDGEAGGLRMLVESLPIATAVPPEGGLGYHGFLVRIADDSGGGSIYLVYDGVVSLAGSGRRDVWLDPSREVERFLLRTGASALTVVERGEAAEAIGPPPTAVPSSGG